MAVCTAPEQIVCEWFTYVGLWDLGLYWLACFIEILGSTSLTNLIRGQDDFCLFPHCPCRLYIIYGTSIMKYLETYLETLVSVLTEFIYREIVLSCFMHFSLLLCCLHHGNLFFCIVKFPELFHQTRESDVFLCFDLAIARTLFFCVS